MNGDGMNGDGMTWRRWLTPGVLATLLLAVVAIGTVALAWTPSGTADPKGWTLTITDTDVDATWERLSSGADYNLLPADTTITLAYSYSSRTDSLQAGNFAGDIGSAWDLGSTADAGSRANFLSRTDSMSFVDAVFDDGYSARGAGYLYRYADTDFRVGTGNFTWSIWVRSPKAANPSAIQTVFSTPDTPDHLKLRYLTDGKLNFVFTDGGTASVACPTGEDSISTVADIYDSTWHHIAVRRSSTELALYQDGTLVSSTTIVNAGSVDPDSLVIGADRGGATRFLGLLDDARFRRAATDTMLFKYEYKVGSNSPDTARVYVVGIAADSSTKNEAVQVPLSSSVTTAAEFRVYELAYADTADLWPVIVYAYDSSPRQARVDSIPGSSLFGGTLLKGVPKRSSFYVDEWACGPADSISQGTLELRVYPRSVRARTPSNYYVAARARVDGATGPAGVIQFPALTVPENGQVEVWALGDYANQAFWSRLRGRKD